MHHLRYYRYVAVNFWRVKLWRILQQFAKFATKVFRRQSFTLYRSYLPNSVTVEKCSLTTLLLIVHSICIKRKTFVTSIYGNSHWSFGCYSNTESIQVTRGDLGIVAQHGTTHCSFVMTITILMRYHTTILTVQQYTHRLSMDITIALMYVWMILHCGYHWFVFYSSKHFSLLYTQLAIKTIKLYHWIFKNIDITSAWNLKGPRDVMKPHSITWNAITVWLIQLLSLLLPNILLCNTSMMIVQ